MTRRYKPATDSWNDYNQWFLYAEYQLLANTAAPAHTVNNQQHAGSEAIEHDLAPEAAAVGGKKGSGGSGSGGTSGGGGTTTTMPPSTILTNKSPAVTLVWQPLDPPSGD